jgi:hypothetical protein
MESKELEGESMEEPWGILFHQKIHPHPWLKLQIYIGDVYGGFERGERGARDGEG